ncbi:MAG: PaaI family thioesterase [Pseudomonadota bacterium]
MVAEASHDVASREALLSMSGLAFMQGILAGRLPPAPIAQVMNARLTAVDDGRVVFMGSPTKAHTNPMGTVHGGWYGTLLDSCLGCAVMTKVPRGGVYTTLEYKVNLVRNLPLGTEVEAIGTVSHAGRSTGVAEGVIRGISDGKLYATGSTTCLIMAG